MSLWQRLHRQLEYPPWAPLSFPPLPPLLAPRLRLPQPALHRLKERLKRALLVRLADFPFHKLLLIRKLRWREHQGSRRLLRVLPPFVPQTPFVLTLAIAFE